MCMNSLKCLPCAALLRMHLCVACRQASQSALPPPLSSSPSVRTEPAQIQFYCIYLFIYSYLFSISEASYRRPANLRSRVAGEPQAYICVCMTVCFQDRIKIQIERKHWNHHFCYRWLYALQPPLLTNSSGLMNRKH